MTNRILAEELYEHLEKTNSSPWEQKGCRKGSRDTKDQLLIDTTIMKDCQRWLTSLATAWIDCPKAYNMVPQSWIRKCMEMFGVAVNVRSFVNTSMKQWNTELTRNMRNLVFGENVQSICCACGAADETVAHIVSECSKLTQKEYKQVTHGNIAKKLHWKLCEKWGFNKAEKWYIHKPEKVLESEDGKILWDFPVQTTRPLNIIDQI